MAAWDTGPIHLLSSQVGLSIDINDNNLAGHIANVSSQSRIAQFSGPIASQPGAGEAINALMNVLLVLLIHLETFELTYLFRCCNDACHRQYTMLPFLKVYLWVFRHILHSLHERMFHHASLNQTCSTTIFCLLLIPLLPELYEWEL